MGRPRVENPSPTTLRARRWRERNREKSREHVRNYAKRHPERVKEMYKFADLKKKYGLTKETYLAMVAEQGGCCAICGENKPLHVDHCHATGRVRKLLCGQCNTAIGLLQESPKLARAAAEYMEKHCAF